MERTIKEENYDLITPVFDMTDCGLSNIDLPYTQYIINTFKYYYPEQINYIIVYDMAWILNGKFFFLFVYIVYTHFYSMITKNYLQQHFKL